MLLPSFPAAAGPVSYPSLPVPITDSELVPTARRAAAGAGEAIHDTEAPDVATSSDDYASRFTGPTGAFLLERQAEALRRLLGAAAPSPRFVIEVGGGHGQLTEAFLAGGCRVSVQGSSDECFSRLRALQVRHAEHLDLRVGPLWQLPYGDRSADLVCAIRLLAHVERWQELLAEMARVTRRHLIVDVPVPTMLQRFGERAWFLKRRLEKNTRPYFIYPMADIVAGLEALDFTVTLAVGQFVVPMAIHRALKVPALSRSIERLAERRGLHAGMGSPVLLLATRRA